LCTSAYLCMYNAQTSSSSQKYLLYFFSSLVLYINHLALKGTLVSFFDLCMHIAYAHHLVYVLYRTETAGYMIPSLIYVLYRSKTAGYMIPSLIYVLYRTETAGYMIPSLIYVLYRTETAGYMIPSLIYVL